MNAPKCHFEVSRIAQWEEVRNRKGSKAGQVMAVVLAKQEPFSISEVEADCPGISRETIRLALREMSREGLIASTGKGRSAKWVRKL